MKNFFIILLMSLLMISVVSAQEITLPNGQTLNIDNLSETEITQAINTAKKSMEAQKQSESILGVVKDVDPNNLQAWSKAISGTIKTICDDLSITVNEFVKTPVGMGVAFLVAYKLAGKELLDNALAIVVLVPLWFFMTGLVLFIAWYFLSVKTVWDIDYNSEGKKVKTNPKRVSRYPWKPVDSSSNDLAPRTCLVLFLIGMQILGTFITLINIL